MGPWHEWARKSSTRQYAPRTNLGTGTELPLTMMATAVTPLLMNTQWAGLLGVMEASACKGGDLSQFPHVKEYTAHCCPGTGPHRLAPQLETLQSSSSESCFLLSYRGCRGFPASGPEGREDMPEGSLLGGPGDPGDVDILLLRGFLKSL